MSPNYGSNLATWPAFSVILLIIVIVICIAVVWGRRIEVKGIGPVVALAFLLPFGVLLVKIFFAGTLEADQLTWHQLASENADYLWGERAMPVEYVTGKEGYIWILGALYALGGPAPMVGVTFNMGLSVLLSLTVAHTTKTIGVLRGIDQTAIARSVRIAAVAVAIAPGTLLWTPSVLREALTMFLYALTVLALLTFVARPGRLHFLLVVVVAVAVMWWIRSSVGYTLVASCLVAVVWISVGRSDVRTAIRLGLITAIGLGAALNSARLTETMTASIEGFSSTTAELSQIASSGFPGLSWENSFTGILSVTAPRILFGPLPWDMSFSPVMLLAAIEGIFWFVAVGLATVATVRVRKEPGANLFLPIVLIMLALFLAGLMFSVGNYGILARFRPVGAILLIPLAATYFTTRTPRRNDSKRNSGRTPPTSTRTTMISARKKDHAPA